MRRLVLIVAVVAVGVGAVIIYYYSSGSESDSGSDESVQVDENDGDTHAQASGPSSLSRARRPLPEHRVELPAPNERDAFVRDRVRTLLDAHPDVATLSSVTCEGEHCRVELDVPDMKKFTPAYERLQDTAFIGVAQSILLANPVPQGDDGAHRVAFTLEFAPAER